jgi:STAS domain
MPERTDTPPLTEVVVADDESELTVARLDSRGADLALVDALMRLQLRVRRRGGQVVLRGASQQLRGLLALVGLADVLRVEGEPERQPELGEELGKDEVVQPRDPPV